ncbi:MAG: periplasmic heavy metal sensor [Deltaproteobacteria bacterium]|nr:periplasmic heavy metal sensor [Deltaproteobacteria bacterium]
MSAFLYGFLGAVAALFLFALARRRRWRRMARLGGPPRFLLRGLFRRLGTRPEQEAVLGGEADALAAEVRALREAGRGLREELAAMLEGPALERAAVEAALAGRLARLEALRHRAAEAVTRVHGALDVGQRRALAELLRRGGHRRHAGACR